ncbi:MAG: RND transporter [Betaproteobacteria bacterium HGW-Betaproteobacteria-22]|nr:MAG: RND transporter [Betaproteobacteria bacterium HGW-Betaproteobacteria-22]
MINNKLSHHKPCIVKPVLLAVSVAMLLSGCQSIWPDYLRPKVAIPEHYVDEGVTANANAKIASDWWKLYQDEVLNSLVEQALIQNKDIQLAVARIEEADAKMREVGAFLLPQIDLNAGAQRTRVTEAGPFPIFSGNPRSNYTIGLNTTFELDFWGKLSRAKEAAKAQALSSRYAKDTVRLTLAGLIATNYFNLRGLEAQLEITRLDLKSRDESLALTRRRLEGGVASALDVHQAEVALATLQAQLAELERLKSLSINQLSVLTGDLSLAAKGLDASKRLTDLPIPPTPPAGLPSQLLESRPDVQQTEQQMVAANANIAVAKAALYPTISLTANLGGESVELRDVLKSAARIWTGGLSLHLPIFDSGKLNAKLDQASAQQKQVLANYEGAVQNAFKEVNDALVNLRQQAVRERALLLAQASAQSMLTVSETRYQSGYSAYLEVLDAQRTWHESSMAFVQARQARLAASVDLFKVLGGGWKAEALR